ncbi:hypothetical protein V6V47_16590 [Micromonospora sp. CPCC 205539]|uniref:hypothetical protein n=1 Tax=Micromonospora sp. CPCC 205539 TaxID=3122408 RepID=UPI002FF3FDF8
MRGIADRLLALIVPAAPVAAGCSTSTYCADCPAPRQNYGRKATRTCCLNEGCTTSYSACYTC